MKFGLSLMITLIFALPVNAQYVGRGNKIFTDDLYYVVSAPIFPSLYAKRELLAGITFFMPYGLTAAYSISNHLYVNANYGFSRRNDHRLHIYESGIGYFYGFGKENQWIHDVSVQASYGKSLIQLDSKDLREDLSNYRYSFQTSIGFRHRNTGLYFSPRFSMIRFHSYEKLYAGEDHPWMYGKFLNGETYQIFDGTLCMRIGGPKISVGVQLGIQEAFGSNLPKVNFYDRLNLRASILLHLKKSVQNDK